MSIRNSLKQIISFAIHGVPKKTLVHISYLHPDSKLLGKRIIITGGGRGLGFSMAKKFKSEGAEVLIAGRNENTLKTSANKIGCKYLKLDVQDVGSFKDFIDQASDILGGLKCLVNNAGISLHERGFLEVEPSQFDSQFDTNLKGAFF